MINYITKPKSIKSTEFDKQRSSLCPKDYRKLYNSNQNVKPLSSLINNHFQGHEIGSEAYVKKSKYRFLKTANISNEFLIDENSIEYCHPIGLQNPEYGNILIVKDGGESGLGEVCYYNLDNTELLDGISAGILAINVIDEYKFYVLGLLKSQHFKDFINLKTPEGSTIRHSKKVALEYLLSFPSSKNEANNKEIITFVGLIVQNIIHKEEEIKRKNKLIDTLISTELEKNQKENNYNFSLPKISMIKANQNRLDSGTYGKEFKKIELLINNYKFGSTNILKNHTASRGQNLQVTNIGQSFYSDYPKKNFYQLITNVEINDARCISKFRYLGSQKKLMLIPENTILLTADGTVGRCIFVKDLKNTITNIHPWLIVRKQMLGKNIMEDVFIALFLGWLRSANSFYEKIKDKANGGGIKHNHLANYLNYPNFQEEKQHEIAQEYYNPQPKNTELSLDNYLEEEEKRNKILGISQLNMEIFTLKEVLNEVVDSIITNQFVQVSLEY